MKSRSTMPSIDITLALACIAFAAFLYAGCLYIPPPFFDPLGSAAVPKACALVITLIAVSLLVRAIPALRERQVPTTPEYRRRPDLAVGIVLLAAAYVGIMGRGWLGFAGATAGFLFTSGVLLGGRSLRVVLISAALAVTIGFGGQYLFSEIFFIDLPQ